MDKTAAQPLYSTVGRQAILLLHESKPRVSLDRAVSAFTEHVGAHLVDMQNNPYGMQITDNISAASGILQESIATIVHKNGGLDRTYIKFYTCGDTDPRRVINDAMLHAHFDYSRKSIVSSQPNRSRIITRGQFNPDLVAANNRAVYADRTLYDHFTIDVFKGDYPTLTDIATLRAAMRQVMPQRAVGHTDQYQFPKLEGFNHGGITAYGLQDTGVWDVHTYPESDDTTPERPFAAVDLLLFDEEKTRQEVRQRVAEAFRTNMLVVNAHNLLKGKNTYRLEPVLPQ